MRSEQEMYRLFYRIADEDDRILAMYLNGSRTNSNAPKDIFQDYDLVYVVENTESFIRDRDWIRQFGDILYMQYPDESPFYPSDRENLYGWLIQFSDGNRVDLHVESVDHALKNIEKDSLCKVLLDKKQILPPLPKASDRSYWITKPSKKEFSACCNEFWWCSNNLAKGMWRKELPYVQDVANRVVRVELERMLGWKIGILQNFSVSVGKSSKYMYRWLTESEYRRYLSTYFGGSIEEAWDSVIAMCDLFEETAVWTANRMHYSYNQAEANAARQFLLHVKELPEDAEEV